ncbi:hypothetical protein COU77_00560 [Candidatus Peregrinibacteria bacterium CG10_big_fil_rev_8_21_14_0_10_49_16]|nr:MAG: hypothetical protein COW95_01710 [Candidatus Peregrinibacteria bacterium CG22_combo_CG10-13_8_21_14_all_49_11]PIR52389.1 MAG: hypothetical protein COU77_00560 [Candidatus Peregrinibacteria bacterium CG10_big_fil_rev_8_21_14_0_10_49_16]
MFRLLLAASLAIGFVSLISPVVRSITEPPVREAASIVQETAEELARAGSGTLAEYGSDILDANPSTLLHAWQRFVLFTKDTRREYERLTGDVRQRADDISTGVEMIQEGKGLIEQGIQGRDERETVETATP